LHKKDKKFYPLNSSGLSLKNLKKLVLEIEPDFDFKLLGMVCAQQAYRMGWLLNHTLGFSLERLDEMEVELSRKKEVTFFDFFEYHDEEQRLEYYLLSNKSEGKLLIPEMRQVDYWLLMRGAFENLNEARLLKQLKQLRTMQTAFYVDPSGLKSREYLIF
jgi:hypothetical protein